MCELPRPELKPTSNNIKCSVTDVTVLCIKNFVEDSEELGSVYFATKQTQDNQRVSRGPLGR